MKFTEVSISVIFLGIVTFTSQSEDTLAERSSRHPHKERADIIGYGPTLSQGRLYDTVVPGLAFGSAAFLLGGVLGPAFHHHFKKGRPVVKYVVVPQKPHYHSPPPYAYTNLHHGYGYSLPQVYGQGGGLGWDSPYYYYHTHHHH